MPLALSIKYCQYGKLSEKTFWLTHLLTLFFSDCLIKHLIQIITKYNLN